MTNTTKEVCSELLEAAKAANDALHQFHPKQWSIPVGKGICEWDPCAALREAIAKAEEGA